MNVEKPKTTQQPSSIIEDSKIPPLKVKKRKKHQQIGHELVKVISMIMHKQKKGLVGLKIQGE